MAIRDFFVPIAKRLNCSFVRLDNDNIPGNTGAGVRQISPKVARTASLQPRAEWVLDITPSEDTIWAGFHKHARYNVRLAERANATITLYEPSKAPLDVFFALMQTTSGRDGFGIFNKEYYASYLQTLSADDGFIVMCSIDGKPAAAGLFVVIRRACKNVMSLLFIDHKKPSCSWAFCGL